MADVFLSAGVRTPFAKAGSVYARRSALELSIPVAQRMGTEAAPPACDQQSTHIYDDRALSESTVRTCSGSGSGRKGALRRCRRKRRTASSSARPMALS